MRSLKKWGYIDLGDQMIERLIYETEKDKKYCIETAFIKNQNKYVSVWRPTLDEPAEWQPAKWRPIYHIHMVRDGDTKFVRPKRGNQSIEGKEVRLPIADLSIDRVLERHIASLKRGEK